MARAVPLALATLAGLGAWLSLGVLAVVDRAGGARVGALPPWWLLGVLIGLFAAAVAIRRWPTARVLPLALTLLPCLPWLPGRVPAAFLIWYGPLASVVWLFVALGLAAPVLVRPGLWRWATCPSRAPWLAATAAIVLFGAGALALQSRLPAGDEPHYLVITQSLLSDGDLRIENNHLRGEYFPYFSGELRPDYLQRGQNGQIYSIHAPGLPVVLAPAFALGGYPASVVMMIALSALGVGLLWTTVWRLTTSASAAWLAAGGWALGAPAYFHAFTIYPDGLGAVGTIGGLWLLVRLERGPELSRRALAGAGATLAALPWLHTRFAMIAAVIGAAAAARLLMRGDRLRVIGVLMAAPVLSAAIWFGYFWVIWGTPNPAAPYGHYTQSAWSNLAPGLPGLLVDQQFGLVTNAPLYALALLGMVSLARCHPRLAVELALLVVPYALAVASYRMWWAGLSAPARFLVAVLPAAALPLGMLWSRAGAGIRAVALVLLALGALMLIPRIGVDEGALLYNARDGVDLMLDWVNRSVNLPLAWPSLHRDAPGIALGDAAIWVVAGGLLGGVALGLSRRFGGAWTWVSGAAAVTVMVASTVVWNRHDGGAFTPNTSALDLVQRWPSSWHAVGWQSRPVRRLRVADVPARLQLTSALRGPARTGAPSLFAAPLVPAGDYEVVLTGVRQPEGRVNVLVGRSRQPIDVLDLNGQTQPGALVLHLPVRAQALTITADARATQTVSAAVLRPRLTRDNVAGAAGTARRASRYGDLRVFFLDDDAFMEPPGFWTRAESVADMVIDIRRLDSRSPAVPPALIVRAGAVATTATLSTGSWVQALALGPGESRLVTLPPLEDAGAWRLRIESGMGFRPGEYEPGSRDFRNLGVWVEVAPASGVDVQP